MTIALDMARTLAMVAGALDSAQEDWWIIGSAAVALHGGDTMVRDVDVIVGVDDARRILPMLGVAVAPGPG